MSIILVLVPTSLLGLLAIALFMVPRAAIAQETASSVTKVATGASLATATGPAFMGFNNNEWQVIGVIASIVLGFLTWAGSMAINWYFKREHLRLAERQAEVGKLVVEDE